MLVVLNQPPIYKQHIALIPAVTVFQDGHQSLLLADNISLLHLQKVDRQKRVAVQHKKMLAQQRHRFFESPTSSKQGWTVMRITDG